MDATSQPLPVPDLEPQRINVHQLRSCAPEKFELIDGYLFSGPELPEHRCELLKLLLVNVGLREAVKLVPEERWQEALAHVYGQGERK